MESCRGVEIRRAYNYYAKQSSELFHIKESVDEIKAMVKEQNGRVRKLEQQTSAIKAIGSSVAVVFSAVIGWLFNTRS